MVATKEAFQVSRSTLFAWQQARNKTAGRNTGLNPKSKRPKQVRSRSWSPEVRLEIKRIREQRPNFWERKSTHIANTVLSNQYTPVSICSYRWQVNR